jgi:hypothetical protein
VAGLKLTVLREWLNREIFLKDIGMVSLQHSDEQI